MKTASQKTCLFRYWLLRTVSIGLLLIFNLLVPDFIWAQKAYYIPKSLIMPLHDQSKQLHISPGVGGGLDLHVSYSFTKRLAVFSTATFNPFTAKRIGLFGDRYNIDKDDYVVKGGLGYFSASQSGWLNVLETYLGVGISQVNNSRYFVNSSIVGSSVTQAQYGSLFWQLNAGHKTERNELAFAIRLGYSQYQYLRFYDTYPNSSNTMSRYDQVWGVTADPVISYSRRFGQLEHNELKFNVQVGLALPVYVTKRNQIDTHTFYDGATVVQGYSEDKVPLSALLGRLSLQYMFNLNTKNR